MTLSPTRLPRTDSSLLIPERFLQDFMDRSNATSREIYFRSLINKYGQLILSGGLGHRERVKIGYQKPGENLVKKNFRPFNEDWIQFDSLANYLRLSKTGLFTLLLILDIAGWDEILKEKWDKQGVPQTIAKFRLLVLINYKTPIEVHRKINFKIRR